MAINRSNRTNQNAAGAGNNNAARNPPDADRIITADTFTSSGEIFKFILGQVVEKHGSARAEEIAEESILCAMRACVKDK